ncbi:MAG: hypothetical protein K1W30_05175 [Lachnospiraceae bacterium]
MDKITGSMEVLNSLQTTADIAGLDQASKELYKNKEVLAVILKGVAREFESYTYKEIMDFIEAESITDDAEVSPSRTNTRIHGDDKEFTALNEKVSFFDTKFRAVNPELSDLEKGILVNLHVDVEPQKTYRPGYPLEKRGIYYLARELCAQLSLVTSTTDYGYLEKCYSIWICRDDIPKDEKFSISFIEMSNTKNYGNCHPAKRNYDLLTLVIIRLGDEVYQESKENPGKDVLEFLHAVMYPHKKEFLDTVKKYIDFSQNQELWKEVDRMCGLGESILLEGESRGIKIGESRGIKIGESRGIKSGIKIGETNGVTRSAKVFKAIQAGETDNNVIAALCDCTVENVVKIRKEFGI